MKKIVLLLSGLILILFGACDSKDGGDVFLYDLAVKFVDQSGKNVLRDIEVDGGQVIDFSENYTFVTWNNEQRKHATTPQLYVASDGKENYLLLNLSITTPIGFSSHIFGDFVCYTIFGDNLPHEIRTEWKKKNVPLTECTKLTIDGKDYPVTYDATLGSYVATVVVNGGEWLFCNP